MDGADERKQFKATHILGFFKKEPVEIPVMLFDESGPAYTEAEWNAGAKAEWEYKPESKSDWLYQNGKPFRSLHTHGIRKVDEPWPWEK